MRRRTRERENVVERAEKKWRMSAFEMLNSKRKFAMFHADAALNAYQPETAKAEMTFNQNASDFWTMHIWIESNQTNRRKMIWYSKPKFSTHAHDTENHRIAKFSLPIHSWI